MTNATSRVLARLAGDLDSAPAVSPSPLGISPEALDVLAALSLSRADGPDAWRERVPDRPTVADIVFALACGAADERALREALAPTSSLVELGLVMLGQTDDTPHEQREVRIDDRMVAFLRGDLAIDRRLAGTAVLHREPGAHDVAIANKIARALDTAGPILVEGIASVGKVAAAIGAITARGPALVCDVTAIATSEDPLHKISLVRRELVLAGARLVLRARQWDATWSAAVRRTVLELVEGGGILAIRDGDEVSRELRGVGNLAARRILVPPPPATVQAEIWRAELGDIAGIERLCERYSLPPGDIAIAAAEIRAEIELEGRTPTIDDLLVAARVQLRHRLGDVAELVSTRLGWSDVVLRPDVADKVRELIDAVQLRDRVMVDWGFEAKLPYGRAISALLSGAPGTGKTMVATVLGKQLGLEVFRVDLSKVSSKYIGETEKNLARVFDEASRCRAILLFDEADSLFAKRTEVKSSNDRFANQEVNFLLQRLENHDGVVILTTNAATAIDKAFLRRIRYRIEFPEPDAAERTRLWSSMIPAEAPLAADVDLESLGRRFPMTGGHIKNAVVRAAYRAMTDGLPAIDQQALVRSALAEWTELGNLTPPETPATDGIDAVVVRGSAPRIEPPKLVPMFPGSVPTVGATTETALIRLLHAPPLPGETIDVAYRRKEQQARELFARLSVLEARTLHKRLTLLDPTDTLAGPFLRMARDRRDRLVAFLAEARRRSALSA